MRSFACCNYEFEPSRLHGFLSLVNVVCLHLEVLLTVCVCVSEGDQEHQLSSAPKMSR